MFDSQITLISDRISSSDATRNAAKVDKINNLYETINGLL